MTSEMEVIIKNPNIIKYRLNHINMISFKQRILILVAALCLNACGATTSLKSPQQQAIAQSNLDWAEQYMAQIRKRDDTQSINDKLAYRPLKTGHGCKPTPGSHVRVHYEAKIAQTGKIVDSSYARGRPANYPLPRMVKAWKQAIPRMSEGSTWELYVHPELAYGAKGSLPSIPPNAALVFNVNLIKADICAYNFKRLSLSN